MRGNRTLGLLIGLGAIAGASIYTIDAREVAVVTSFGATVKTLTEPGLYFRAPWPIPAGLHRRRLGGRNRCCTTGQPGHRP